MNHPETTLQQPSALIPLQEAAVHSAFNAARARHADFDILQPILTAVGHALFPPGVHPDWSKVNCEDFVETLYVVAKHAYFTAEVREAAFANALQAAQPSGVM